MIPNERFVTAGRLYSCCATTLAYLQLLRDLSGQGLISRFTKAQFEREDLAARLEEFVPGTGGTAREKNRLFNFVWDLTSGNNANRVAAFEHVNATPPGAMRATESTSCNIASPGRHTSSNWSHCPEVSSGCALGSRQVWRVTATTARRNAHPARIERSFLRGTAVRDASGGWRAPSELNLLPGAWRSASEGSLA